MFVRSQKNLNLFLDPYVFQFDREFCTTHDYKISTIIAYKKLSEYIAHETALLKYPAPVADKPVEAMALNLRWMANKVALVELIYALHANGCINSGNSIITEIASFFERALALTWVIFTENISSGGTEKLTPLNFLIRSGNRC